jgi:hypothetical protein
VFVSGAGFCHRGRAFDLDCGTPGAADASRSQQLGILCMVIPGGVEMCPASIPTNVGVSSQRLGVHETDRTQDVGRGG